MKYSLIEIDQIAYIEEYGQRIRRLREYLDSCIKDARVYTRIDRTADYLDNPNLEEHMKRMATHHIVDFLIKNEVIVFDFVKEGHGRATLVTSLKVVL